MTRTLKEVEQEVNYTMERLGRSTRDSKISGEHLKKIMSYLIVQKSENYDMTVYKLVISVGIGTRYVIDYLRGLEAWGLLRAYLNGQTKVWEWISIYESDEERKEKKKKKKDKIE